jgi:hypothetical protein
VESCSFDEFYDKSEKELYARLYKSYTPFIEKNTCFPNLFPELPQLEVCI